MLFTKKITNRISYTLILNKSREQTCFQSGFSTTYHIQTVSQVLDSTNEYIKTALFGFHWVRGSLRLCGNCNGDECTSTTGRKRN